MSLCTQWCHFYDSWYCPIWCNERTMLQQKMKTIMYMLCLIYSMHRRKGHFQYLGVWRGVLLWTPCVESGRSVPTQATRVSRLWRHQIAVNGVLHWWGCWESARPIFSDSMMMKVSYWHARVLLNPFHIEYIVQMSRSSRERVKADLNEPIKITENKNWNLIRTNGILCYLNWHPLLP